MLNNRSVTTKRVDEYNVCEVLQDRQLSWKDHLWSLGHGAWQGITAWTFFPTILNFIFRPNSNDEAAMNGIQGAVGTVSLLVVMGRYFISLRDIIRSRRQESKINMLTTEKEDIRKNCEEQVQKANQALIAITNKLQTLAPMVLNIKEAESYIKGEEKRLDTKNSELDLLIKELILARDGLVNGVIEKINQYIPIENKEALSISKAKKETNRLALVRDNVAKESREKAREQRRLDILNLVNKAGAAFDMVISALQNDRKCETDNLRVGRKNIMELVTLAGEFRKEVIDELGKNQDIGLFRRRNTVVEVLPSLTSELKDAGKPFSPTSTVTISKGIGTDSSTMSFTLPGSIPEGDKLIKENKSSTSASTPVSRKDDKSDLSLSATLRSS